MKDSRRAMIMRNKMEDLKKTCIPLDDHLVIDIFVDGVCDDYIGEKLQASRYDELEQTGVYLGIFNDDIHMSFTSKEVPEDSVKTGDKGKAIGETKMRLSKPRCRVREIPEAVDARECFKAFTLEIEEKEGTGKKRKTDEA
ncbi:hypothetical protein L1987_46158 [Smallanthus sonchifolius]|uniref:Uncharacterized protein n=1 Tax=Smallanthus sonchifolius TaxID=185202 RepID=A0ACB9FYD9_9ASTR|nr:hypothetical protein L1987_46158 [Smallanthus sonchifolius]